MPEKPPITVHCFFQARCKHKETGPDMAAVHDAMEAHYTKKHQAQIDQIVGENT